MRHISILIALTLASAFAHADLAVHNESELGSTIVSGNTQSETYNAAQKTVLKWDDDLFKIAARYLRSTAKGVESAKNWDGTVRYERSLSEKFSIYASYGLESDIYAGYVQRNDYGLGGKYFIAQSPDTNWTAELGYENSFSQFVVASPDAQASFVRIYSEFSQKFTPGSSGKFWFEYLPNITNSNGYRYNFEPSITMILNEIFSLKVANLFKYQNELPKGFSQNLDSFFTLSLVSKF